MKREIVFWHGKTDSMFDDLIKLVGCSCVHHDNGDYTLYYEGTLDNFVARWKRPIMVNFEHKYIAVTMNRGFGQQ